MNLKEFIHSDYVRDPHIVLFGNPVAHSFSPLMHNTAARYHGMDVRYYAVQLEKNEVDLVAKFLKNEQLKGVNLTIPFKYDFVRYCDSLDPVSSKLKAANALVKSKNAWRGYNSDAYGFSVPLETYKREIYNKQAIVFGSGGAAKAAAYAAHEMGINKVSVVSRNPSAVGEAVRRLADSVISYEKWPEVAEYAKLIVNTTPLGMEPHASESPVKDFQTKHLHHKICYDLIYNPSKTKFLKQAEHAGAVTLNGLDMLVHQGSKLFELWTGKRFPIPIIQNELQEKVRAKN